MMSKKFNVLPLLQAMKREENVDGNIKHAKFYQFKEMAYFKDLLSTRQDAEMRQILLENVYVVTLKTLNQEKYSYIPFKNGQQQDIGWPLDPSIIQLPKKTTLLRINRKINDIIRHIFNQQIPAFSSLKLRQIFNIFSQTLLESFPFNRTISRKGEPFIGLYYVLQGQIKTIVNNSNSLTKIIQPGGFMGLDEFVNCSENYLSTFVSNCNGTKLLLLKSDVLSQHDDLQNGQKSLGNIFREFYEQTLKKRMQIKTLSELSQSKQKQSKKLVKNSLKLNDFVKKVQIFKANTTLQDVGFNEYLGSKKIMLQLKQTMMVSKMNRKNKPKLENWKIKIESPIIRTSKLNSNVMSSRSGLLKSCIMRRIDQSSLQESKQNNLQLFINTASSFSKSFI